MNNIKKAALIGGGVIGGGWAARMMWHGIDVTVFDPHPEAERRVRKVLHAAEPALQCLYRSKQNYRGSIKFRNDIKKSVEDADFIQESIPENEDLKRHIFAEIDHYCRPDALICSSTSGLLPSRLQADMARPGRFLVGHPFNPVYLLPLVELCAGERTDPAAVDQARDFYSRIGMYPLRLCKEIDGFISDRLQEALWREALWLVKDEIATMEEIDDAIRYGPGLRWALMGTFLTYRLAGGEDGMRHFLQHFAPTLKLPWTKLTDVPDLDDALIDRMVEQSDDQADGLSNADLVTKRDECLVGILHALQENDFAAGKLLAVNDNRPA